jgi:hypothetical protein
MEYLIQKLEIYGYMMEQYGTMLEILKVLRVIRVLKEV